jgi:Suppressor of fused protein (SUFU)
MPNFEKIVINQVTKLSGGRVQFVRHEDLSCLVVPDLPDDNISTVVSLGISNFAVSKSEPYSRVFVELVTAGYSKFDLSIITRALNKCGEKVKRQETGFTHGQILTGIFDSHFDSFLLTSPFSWDNRFTTVEIGENKLAWLQAVPICRAERAVFDSEGFDALERLMERSDVDIFDLSRESVL